MRRLALVFIVSLAVCQAAMAVDIAISTQANWWSQAAADREMQEIVDNVTAVSVELFATDEQDALASWVRDHTGDGISDLLILCGQFPDTIYTPGNSQSDDSLAELFLDDGNAIVNTGDYMFYVVNGAGTNAAGGLQTMMDIGGITMWDDNTSVTVTSEGQEYTATLVNYETDRPFHLDELQGDWEPELILAQNSAGTRADPVIVVNTDTGGRLGIFYQTSGQDDDPRGEVISEWINNWYLKTVGGGGNPLARRPEPEDGAMLEATWVNLTWRPGHYAVSHDVYIGDDFEDVDSGAAHTFVGNTPQAMQIVGFAGFPFPDGLVPGTTYYWRIDEVNDANAASPWKGDVWSFWVPSKRAYDPDPADGVGVVLTSSTLSWATGFGGKLAHLYFGKDAAEVEAGTGTTYKGPVVATTYDPGPLEEGTTYYWRVDQFDGVETHKGDVWSLTTVPSVTVADPSLLGWWTLDEGEGTTVVDVSGHGGHGSFVGEPQWADGYQGMALEFSGSGNYVDCGDDAGAGATGDFTIAAWAKLAAGNSGHYGGIAGKLDNVGGYHGFAIVRHSSNVYRLWVSDGDTAGINGIAGSDVLYTDTEWHHVTGVREGRNNILYVDGVRQAASNATDFVPSADFFHIGRQYSHLNDRYFHGKIDDVRVYNRALTEAEIAEVMNGDTKTAGSPAPGRDALLDIREISSLSWSQGSTAASHDVYLGQDRDAVAGADNSAAEFQGNQAAATLSLAGVVEFGGGDYYWRVDEVESGGAVNAGTIWKFTVPDYLIVDNFESYNNVDPPSTGSNRVFDNWIDGFGTMTNGALVGNDVPPYGEHSIVKSGNQSLVYAYDNAGKTSEATLTLAKGDWTVEGVAKLSLWFRGASANAPDKIYVALNGTAVVYHDDASATQMKGWNQWVVDLSAFGVGLTNVNSITIGIGTKNAPSPAGGAGTMYFDEIVLIQ